MLDGQAGYLNTGDITLGVAASSFLAMDVGGGITNLDFDLGGFGVSADPAAVARPDRGRGGPCAYERLGHGPASPCSTTRRSRITEADLNDDRATGTT